MPQRTKGQKRASRGHSSGSGTIVVGSTLVVRFPALRSVDTKRRIDVYLKWLGYVPHLTDYVTDADPNFITWMTPFNANRYKIYTRPLSELNLAPLGYFPFEYATHKQIRSQAKSGLEILEPEPPLRP